MAKEQAAVRARVNCPDGFLDSRAKEGKALDYSYPQNHVPEAAKDELVLESSLFVVMKDRS